MDGLVDDYEGARLGDFEIDALAIWRVTVAVSALRQTSLTGTNIQRVEH